MVAGHIITINFGQQIVNYFTHKNQPEIKYDWLYPLINFADMRKTYDTSAANNSKVNDPISWHLVIIISYQYQGNPRDRISIDQNWKDPWMRYL